MDSTSVTTSICEDWTDITEVTCHCSGEDTPRPALDHLALLRGAGLSPEDAVAICDALGAMSVEVLSFPPYNVNSSAMLLSNQE